MTWGIRRDHRRRTEGIGTRCRYILFLWDLLTIRTYPRPGGRWAWSTMPAILRRNRTADLIDAVHGDIEIVQVTPDWPGVRFAWPDSKKSDDSLQGRRKSPPRGSSLRDPQIGAKARLAVRPPRKRGEIETGIPIHRTRRGTAESRTSQPASPRPARPENDKQALQAWRGNGGAPFAADAFSSKVGPLGRFLESMSRACCRKEMEALETGHASFVAMEVLEQHQDLERFAS